MNYIKLKDNEGLHLNGYCIDVLGVGISFDYPNKIRVHKKSGRVITYPIGEIVLYNVNDDDERHDVVIEDEFSIEKFRKQYEEMNFIKLKDTEWLYSFCSGYCFLGIGISFDYPEIKVHLKSGRVISCPIGEIGLHTTKDINSPAVVIEDESSIEKFRKQYED